MNGLVYYLLFINCSAFYCSVMKYMFNLMIVFLKQLMFTDYEYTQAAYCI